MTTGEKVRKVRTTEVARAAVRKGALFERTTARALRPWWPEPDGARRSRDAGSRSTSDTGDIAGTGTRLFWSLKDNEHAKKGSEPDWLFGEWFAEAVAKAGDRIPVLVVKRKAMRDPLRQWCYLRNDDFVLLSFDGVIGPTRFHSRPGWVRLELRDAVSLFEFAELTKARPAAA